MLCSEPDGVEEVRFDKFELAIVADAGFTECEDYAELRISLDLRWVQEWYVSAT